jgi:hypothetical protein
MFVPNPKTPIKLYHIVGPQNSCSTSVQGHFRKLRFSVDHIVGLRNNQRGNVESECLRGLEIDYQLDFGGFLDREIARPFTLQNAPDIGAGEAIGFGVSPLR